MSFTCSKFNIFSLQIDIDLRLFGDLYIIILISGSKCDEMLYHRERREKSIRVEVNCIYNSPSFTIRRGL